MSKKFTSAPKPKTDQLLDEDIQAFVNSGPGHDRDPVNTEIRENVNVETRKHGSAQPRVKLARLCLDLPAETRQRFKVACSAAGYTMNNVLFEFVVKRTDELEAKTGISRKPV